MASNAARLAGKRGSNGIGIYGGLYGERSCLAEFSPITVR
jgi:hypothetical protein